MTSSIGRSLFNLPIGSNYGISQPAGDYMDCGGIPITWFYSRKLRNNGDGSNLPSPKNCGIAAEFFSLGMNVSQKCQRGDREREVKHGSRKDRGKISL